MLTPNAAIMRRRWNLPVGKTHVVYNAVDTRLFFPRQESIDDSGPLRLLFVGKYWKRKGLCETLGAVEMLGQQVTLNVAGLSGKESPLLQVVSSLGLGERVRFFGVLPRAQMAQLYRDSDVLLLPSHREALGVAALEGMASGLPVIATQVGGIPEIVDHETTGLLVPVHSSEAIAAAVRRLLDVHFRMQLGRQGRERALNFSVDRLVTRLGQLYS